MQTSFQETDHRQELKQLSNVVYILYLTETTRDGEIKERAGGIRAATEAGGVTATAGVTEATGRATGGSAETTTGCDQETTTTGATEVTAGATDQHAGL